MCKPSYKKVAFKNFSIVFPRFSENEKENLLRSHLIELSKVLVDTLRVKEFSKTWIESNVTFTNKDGPIPILDQYKEHGLLLCSAHLGPFESLAQILPLYGLPLNFIARAFKNKKINDWWVEKRSSSGAQYIPRQGAALGMFRVIKKKEVAGIIFDQNVTRDNALFVPLFGVKAATTKIVPYALLKTKAPLFFVSSRRCDDGKIIISMNQVSYLDEIKDMTEEDAFLFILKKLHEKLEEAILDYPEGWFWFHKRWKTRPEGEKENFYT